MPPEARTLSRTIGGGFEVSCPIVVQNGRGADIFIIRKPIYNFTLTWNGHEARLGIGLSQV